MKVKRLIPAVAMLLISAMLLGTSTFAWFSMNTTVTANNMQITAKTDDTYLLINSGENDTAAEIQAAGQKATTLSSTAELFPASPAMTTEEVAYLTTSGKTVSGAAITTAGQQVGAEATQAANAALVDDEENWFTAKALAPTAAAIDTTTARQLESFTDYVDIQTVYLTVAVGSNPAYQLSVTPTFTQLNAGEDLTAVKAIVVTSDGGYAAISSANNGSAVDIKGANTALTDSTVITVTVYLYVDGDETPIYTNNKADLKGVQLDLQFDVSTSAS